MKYRNYFYKQIEVSDHRERKAIMYRCSDEALLEHVQVTSFTKFTEKQMREAIDDYIDNVDHYKKLKVLTYEATKEFLNK
jgi:hypothetical protein|tara:strand:- start:2 stop:241 length:240 start_codon:yes stop_codon:yes gene_type:complete